MKATRSTLSFWLPACLVVLTAIRPASAEEKPPDDPPKEEGPAKEDADKEGEAEGTDAPAKPLSFEALLQLNGAAIFGGTVKVKGEEFEALYNGDGQFAAAFEGAGIFDSKSEKMKGTNRNFFVIEKKDGVEKLLPGFTALGMEKGTWTCKFPIAGNLRLDFGFRIPNLINQQSSFRVRMNWEKGTGYECDFFKKVSFISAGTERGFVNTSIPEFTRPASAWLPRKKESNKASLQVQDGKILVRFNGKDMVSFPKVADKGGRIAFDFNKIVFTLDNVKIAGKYDRAWCQKRMDELKKAGKLKEKDDSQPEAVDPSEPPPEAGNEPEKPEGGGN